MNTMNLPKYSGGTRCRTGYMKEVGTGNCKMQLCSVLGMYKRGRSVPVVQNRV